VKLAVAKGHCACSPSQHCCCSAAAANRRISRCALGGQVRQPLVAVGVGTAEGVPERPRLAPSLVRRMLSGPAAEMELACPAANTTLLSLS